MECHLINENSSEYLLKSSVTNIDLTFLDPPFNQGKKYNTYKDNLPPEKYWFWMQDICKQVFEKTSLGGAIYFMQREKNVQYVLDVLHNSGWYYQNLIIWKKKTSAVPKNRGFGKHYQVIVFATKDTSPRVFNKLRIDPPLLVTERYQRPNGLYVTDVWDDIRELTSGYFAGSEPLRKPNGDRMHVLQSPVDLLARIILSSTKTGDLVFDPFAGTGTTLVVAKQLNRNSIGIEIDSYYCKAAQERIFAERNSDDISRLKDYYRFTDDLDKIWSKSKSKLSSSTGDKRKNTPYQLSLIE